jgi:outer membrane protein OmpA-like peptidoglycan-associated protein
MIAEHLWANRVSCDTAHAVRAIVLALIFIVPMSAREASADDAAPPVSRTALCFFAAGSAVLGRGCETFAREVAQAWRAVPETAPTFPQSYSRFIAPRPFHVVVYGHADTAEAATGRGDIATQRARAVAQFLIDNGVPPTHVTYRGFNATQLFVPTGANVQEPQNRRVEIVAR